MTRSWLGLEPRGFGLPVGPLAGLMGRLMAALNGTERREVLGLLGDVAGEHVVEVGYGPGALAGELVAAGATVAGADPSPAMVAAARRRNAAAVASGTVLLVRGTAEATGLPAGRADVVVTMNTVPMWTDLAAGCAEARRLLRPGGRLVIAWHGGRRPTRAAARMALPEDALAQVDAAVRHEFGAVERVLRDHVTAWTATAPP